MEGFKVYRHKNNPKEKELHDKFIADHIDCEKWTCPVDLLVFPSSVGNDTLPSDYLTDREKRIVISTIQWLGSPVGKGFLSSCGFELKEK